MKRQFLNFKKFYIIFLIDHCQPMRAANRLYAVFNSEREAKSLFNARIGWKWSINKMVYTSIPYSIFLFFSSFYFLHLLLFLLVSLSPLFLNKLLGGRPCHHTSDANVHITFCDEFSQF